MSVEGIAPLDSLWAYLTPALDRVMKSSDKPTLDAELYIGVHSAIFNYMSGSKKNNIKRATEEQIKNLNNLIDGYFTVTARELLNDVPQENAELVPAIVSCFNRYSAGAHIADRMLNYFNRHWVIRMIDEHKGWLTPRDIPPEHRVDEQGHVKRVSKVLQERRIQELRKWGDIDAGSKAMEEAESCAEAASDLDRVVHIYALALRRFRTELLEPLLGAEGRFTLVVQELLVSSDIEEEARRKEISELADMLRRVGVQPDHLIRRKLEEYLAK